jgi:Zn-finger nucleic acid-binding protein
MQAVQRGEVEIDVCTDCRGVWLDRGELEKLLGGLRAQAQEDAQERAQFTKERDEFYRDPEAYRRSHPQNPSHQPYPPQQPYPSQQGYQGYGERGDYGERGEGSYDPRTGHYYKKKKRFDIFDIFD